MITLKNLSKVYRTTEVETTALREHQPGSAQRRVRRGDGTVGLRQVDVPQHRRACSTILPPANTGSTAQNIAGFAESALSDLRKNAIGLVFQSFNLIDELNVEENVELALLYHADVSAR